MERPLSLVKFVQTTVVGTTFRLTLRCHPNAGAALRNECHLATTQFWTKAASGELKAAENWRLWLFG